MEVVPPVVIPLHKPNLGVEEAIEFAQANKENLQHIMVVVLTKDGNLGVATSRASLSELAAMRCVVDKVVLSHF